MYAVVDPDMGELLALFCRKICNGQKDFSFSLQGADLALPQILLLAYAHNGAVFSPFGKSWIRHCMYVFTELIFMLCFYAVFLYYSPVHNT